MPRLPGVNQLPVNNFTDRRGERRRGFGMLNIDVLSGGGPMKTWTGRQRLVIVYAVGAALGGLLGLTVRLPLIVALPLAAGLTLWLRHLTTLPALQRQLILRRVAGGAGFGAVLGLAQLAASAAFLASGRGPVSLDALVTLFVILVACGALWGALSGDGRASGEPAQEDGSSAEAQRSDRAAAVKKFGLRGFARRAAFRLSEARKNPDDAKGLEEFGP
jgi:hypothetical protein